MTPSTVQDDRVHLGVSWYPECWPAEEWPADVARMKEVNISLVRLFEFAWVRFEPGEGNFDFAWAREVLDLLHASGIKAMLGTPTAAPPAWLTSAYPEVLGTGAGGVRKTHGKRKHYNHHSQAYRRHSRRIVEAMVRELGGHPAVHSWQIDNEMSGFDYGGETREAFHAWLEKRYGDVGTLNRTWGLDFWSQAYDRFDQVPLCTAALGSIEMPERHHPSLLIAIARFQNEAWTDFIREQAEVIRAGSDRPITTNMTGAIGAMDWFAHFRVLDRSGASMYADLNYYHYNFLRFDRLRAEKPHPYWLLETAPNWSGGGPVWNIHHDERGVRAFSWLSVLLGGSMVLYWQWRSHWAGQEMQHGTCVTSTGDWSPGKETWARLGREFDELSGFLLAHPAQRAGMALVTSSESAWCFSIDPIDPQKNNYLERFRDDLHVPLVNRHWHRDVIDPAADFSPYRVLLLPRLPMLDDAAVGRLRAWVEAGGTAVIGPMTGYRTEEMTARTDRVFGALEALMGGRCSLRFSPHWVEETIDVRFEDGGSCHPSVWCEAFEPEDGTTVRARYEGGYGEGHTAVLDRRLGKGRVLTIGCPLDEERLMAVVEEAARDAGLAPLAAAGPENEGVLLCPRAAADGSIAAMGLVNLRKEARRVELPSAGKDLIGGEPTGTTVELEPLEVRLVRFDGC